MSVFKRSRHPVMPIRTLTGTGEGGDLEMMKVEVTVNSHVHTDMDSLGGGSDDRKVTYTP